MVRTVKETVRIPVIASGDVFSAGAAFKIKEETGCDAVMVARGALGNPWIFGELTALCGKSVGQALTPHQELLGIMKRHLVMLVDYYGEKTGVITFRKFFAWYTRGVRNAKLLRPKAVRISGLEEMTILIDEIEMPQSPGSSPPASQASPCDRHPAPAPVRIAGSLC
ncbi:MAG: tRNA-dihydrouridine synthase B [Syntrophorhabdaceae bacterium PtaU1.Bin034]|nr:MAG: tRNA-dihydrouridine synthase B [Syntrophorhabdaceae bacterium PtaU1.Bin034]